MTNQKENISSPEQIIEITEAKPEDYPVISDLINLAYDTPPREGGFTSKANETEDKIRTEVETGTKIFVAKINDRIIGTERYTSSGDFCVLNRLAVDPNFRQKGIGRKLVNHTLTRIKETGAKIAKLEVLKEKELASYYEKFGFHIISEEPHHKHTLIHMEKNLN